MEKYIPKVSDKVFGFDYKQTRYNNLYNDDMDFYVGELGVVSIVHEEKFLVKFDDNYWWYPIELANLALKKEESGVMAENEIELKTQVIPWQVGQEVYCILHGQGVVQDVLPDYYSYPVKVDCEGGIYSYTKDGKFHKELKSRTLFFSEPEIIAEKFPPKKPFTPTLKEGDSVVVKHKRLEDKAILTVEREEEDVVWFKEEDDGYYKTAWNFFKIGEEILFN